MSLRIIYGRAGSGKSWFCLNEIKKRLGENNENPLLLIVPEQFSLQAEKNLIRTLGAEGTMKAEVLSFRRMAYRVFSEVGGLSRPHINASGRSILILRIIDEHKESLKYFSKAAAQKGFVNTLLKTISEMKRYNVTPEDLKNACSNIKENETLKLKLDEICHVYSEFERRLHERYIDVDDDLTELSLKLPESVQFDGAEIYIDEFSGFTPQEYKVIHELLRKNYKVSICLCTDSLPKNSDIDSSDLFSTTKSTALKLLKIASEDDIEILEPVELNENHKHSSILPRFRDSAEIGHLEKQFFSFPPVEHPEATSDISVFVSANIHKEVEDTARNIIKLCRDKGMRFRDIAVVCRNLDIYEKQISTIFTEFGIPFFIDVKKDISKHPLILLILSAIEIFINNWTYEAVFRYLKTGFTNIERDNIDLIENYVLACGIKGSSWTRHEPWEYRPGTDFSERSMTQYEENCLSKINEIRELMIGPLTAFRLKTKGKKKCIEICRALYDFLCTIGVPEKLEERIEFFRNNSRLDLANEYSQVWNIIMEVLDQVVEAVGEEQVSMDKFKGILETGFSEYSIGLIPPTLDQVLIGSAERSKSHDIGAMFVLGVNDGVFPAALNSEGILSDRERESLRSLGIELARDTRARAFEEQFLVYTTLTNAEKYLRLSYSVADHEGRALRPSVIIPRLKKIFPKIKEESNIIFKDTDKDNLDLVSVPAPTFNVMINALRKQVEGFKVNKIWWDVYNWYLCNEQWDIKRSRAIEGISYSNRTGRISRSKARKLYGNAIYTTISRMEQFMSCPFSYYIQYGLKAKERKVYKLDAPDIGTFMHTVIDRFSKAMQEKNMSFRKLEKDWCAKEISDIVDDMLSKSPGWILGSSERFRHLSSRLKRIIVRSVWLIAEHIKRSGFEPVGYEVVFGDSGDYPPIVVDLPSGEKINLTGRIDRVDLLSSEDGSYIRIVDYKSGSKAFKLSDVYYGLQIQLIAYMDAMLSAKELHEKPMLPGGIFYLKLDDPIIKTDRDTSKEDIEEAIMKKLRMKGLLLADVKLVKEMDRQIEGESLLVPARMNKGDVLGKSSAASLEQFELLQKYVRDLLSKIGEEMINGEISISPYKKKNITACSYCKYLSICQFDTKIKENSYRVLKDVKENEVWDMFKGGAE